MTVENSHAFLDKLKEKGPNPELMSKIGTDFNSDHIDEALIARGTSKDELLKAAAGGSSTSTWVTIGVGASIAAASA